jgi:hypothetical protein
MNTIPTLPGRRLFFIHIPHTTGYVLKHALIANYGFRNIFPGYCVGPPDEQSALRFMECSSKLVHMDHAPRSILGEKCLAGNITLTMLRDPVDRVLEMAEGCHAAEDALWSPHFHDAFDRHVSYLCEYPAVLRQGMSDLRSAVDFLESDNVLFGMTEMYEESLALFSLLLGWDKLRSASRRIPELSRGTKQEAPEKMQQAMLLSGDDIILYETAKNIFMQRIDALGEIFCERLAYVQNLRSGLAMESVAKRADSAA